MINTLKKIIRLKTCTNCKKTKPLSEFQYITSRNAYVSQCRDCINTKRLAKARLKGVKPRMQITNLARGVKICSNCKNEKPLSDFYYNITTNTYNYLCKECARAKDKQKRLAKGIMSASERNQMILDRGYNICSVCDKKKKLDEFDADKRTGNISGICRECHQEHYRKYREENKDRIIKYRKEYYTQNREEKKQYSRDYRISHLEQVRQADKLWREKNHEKIKEYKADYYEKNKERLREKYHEYYENNSDKLKAYQKKYREENAEKVFERRKKYRERNAEIIKQRKKEYAIENKDKINAYFLRKLREDELFKLKFQIRNLVRMSLKSRGFNKTSSTAKILGCDYDTFWQHLLKSWKRNYGKEYNGEPYHIDHIIPLATAKTKDDVIKLCHYSNLQMLKPENNMSKKANLSWTPKR